MLKKVKYQTAKSERSKFVIPVKKIKLKYIVLLISLALFFLATLQIYQFYQLYEKKSEELNKHIENVLSRVAIRHEKAADLKRYTSYLGKDFSGQYKKALKQEFQNLLSVKESVSIKDTFIVENGTKEKYLHITGYSYDSITHVKAKHSVLARDISELSSFLKSGINKGITRSDSSDLSFKLDKRVIQSLFKKSKYINELMVSIFKNVNLRTPADRVNLAFLDSIMSTTFKNEGIDTKFKYAIEDENGAIIHFPSYTERYDLNLKIADAKKVQLFPGNIFDEKLTLLVSFPEKQSFLLREIIYPIIVSLFILTLLVITFIILFRSIRKERQLAIVKSDFISNMTHEFKTPISTISLACEALNDSDVNNSDMEALAPFIRMIDDENKRLGNLVEQILKSAETDRKDFKLKKEKVDLNELVATVVSKARMHVTNGEIELHQAIGMMPYLGDAFHDNNLISNLVDNAIKYSKKNEKIAISISTEKIKNGDYRLTVKDNGIGIKNEHINKIFDKLYRVPTGNVHNVKGYGLGLNYVKSIVEEHGWTIQVKSKYGVGTSFIITIKN